MKTKYIVACILMLIASVSYAQTTSDIMRFSSSQAELGTARTISMGGAFTSLGADVSSININPAGLGMYLSSDISFTPVLNISTTKPVSMTQDGQTYGATTNTVTNFNMGNFSGVYTIQFKPENTLKTLSLALSYNRMANFNQYSQTDGIWTEDSIGDAYAATLGSISPSSITADHATNGSNVYPYLPTYMWASVMAYNNGMIDYVDGSYQMSTLFYGDITFPIQTIERSGYVDNYSLAGGFNINHWLYLGMTLSYQHYRMDELYIYEEYGDTRNVNYTSDFYGLNTQQGRSQSADAFDFRVGATIQPISGLRIGLAYHAPCYYYVSEYYNQYQKVTLRSDPNGADQWYDIWRDYNIVTSHELLTGISYRFKDLAILSFDYRLNMNGTVKISNLPVADMVNDQLRSNLRNNSEYRLGVEFNINDFLFLRGGYSFIESPYKADKGRMLNAQQGISAGIGYKGKAFYCNLAYQHLMSRNEYDYYDYTMNGETYRSDNYIQERYANDLILLTLGVRL